MKILQLSLIIPAIMVLFPTGGVDELVAGTAQQSSLPPTELIDYVIHSKGNIVTAVFNWGLIGGFSDVPSGEWPKGSGRNYIGELKYWMGATLPNGDTVVANASEDFNPEIDVAVSLDQTIHFSTDSTRYDYDPFDTVGLGVSAPAYGWRHYDLETDNWIYNRKFNPCDSSFVTCGPIAQQESQYIMNDERLGYAALGVMVSQTIYQWNFDYNKDIMFVELEIENVSDNDYTDFAFGLYVDIDVGGWFEGENGRLGDLVAYDSTENLAWIYDQDDYDPGWGASIVAGRMGTKYIETPGGRGMTGFRTGIWDSLPDSDQGRFALLNSEQFDDILPPADQYYIQCTNGIELSSGDVVRVVYALIAAQTDEEMVEKSQMAQVVYDNFFTGPEPPPQPGLRAEAGDKKVHLYWGNDAEDALDPLSCSEDFIGYKIYRSTNYGATWGPLINNPDGSQGPDYIPLATFRKDETTGMIRHSYIDTNLVNGFEYWYAVVAFDEGDTTISLKSLSSARGRPGEDSSAVRIIPRTDPAGYYPIQQTVEHRYSGDDKKSDGSIAVEVFDNSQFNGNEYKVVFEEQPLQTYWHLLDDITGDTLLASQTDQTADLEEAQIVEGLQVLVTNGEREPRSMSQTAFSGSDTTVSMMHFFGSVAEVFGYPQGGDIHFRSTYEIRFTATGSQGYWWWDDVTPVQLPFEIWNTSLGYQVIAEIGDFEYDQEWDPEVGDYIVINNTPYDGSPKPEGFPYQMSWVFRFDTAAYGQTGDVYTIEGAPLNSANDEFYFTTPGIDTATAQNQMDQIKVVPNPYLAYADWEHEAGERRIEFIHLPDDATIRIYTLAGDLVVTLKNEDDGTVAWDLRSVNEQGIAPGIYLYHVESPFGEKIGKFAIIK